MTRLMQIATMKPQRWLLSRLPHVAREIGVVADQREPLFTGSDAVSAVFEAISCDAACGLSPA
jgi:hypothetical protein